MILDRPSATETLPRHSVDLRSLSWATRLTCDYYYDTERLTPFFAQTPDDTRGLQAAIGARQDGTDARIAIADVALDQLANRDAPTAALTSARRLADPSSVAIVTGQQAGLFGGPLFTLLKAVTTVRKARDVSRDQGVPAVPVFWVDAEDHDLAQIRHCRVMTEDLSIGRVSVAYPTGSGTPASAVVLDDSASSAIDKLHQLLPETEFTGTLIDRLREIYRPGRGTVDAFCRWLDALLGSSGLVVFDGSDPATKPLVRHLFARELEGKGAASRLAAAAGHALSELGYHAQVTPAEDSVALFHLGKTRRPIRVRPQATDSFQIDDWDISGAELRREVSNNPERFSPSVLLRPLVQDALFPTVVFVSGPNELAYLAQLREVYEHFDIPMPVISPRVSATIVDRSTLKFLERFDVNFSRLQAQDEGLLNSLLTDLLPNSVIEVLDATEQSISQRLVAVSESISTVDPTLVGATETTRSRMERDLTTLRGKIVQAAKRRDATLRRQFHRARTQTFPNGQPQERAIGSVYFLNRHGPQLIDQLLKNLPADTSQHWLLTV